MFLDADDYLDPDAARAVVDGWTDRCTKVQFRLSLVDEHGVRLGADPPHTIAMPSGDIVRRLLELGRYPTPVLSGNAYARWFLNRILPAPEEELRINLDGYLNAVAPFFGEIVSLDGELGAYRVHGANAWAFAGGATAAALRRRVEHDLQRERFIRQAAGERGLAVPPQLVLRDWSHVLHRLSVLRLEPNRPVAPTDGRLRLFRAGVRALRRNPDLPTAERGLQLVVLAAVAVVPTSLARRLVPWVLGGGRRPPALRLAVRAVRGIGGTVGTARRLVSEGRMKAR
jgi:hypothetical protein